MRVIVREGTGFGVVLPLNPARFAETDSEWRCALTQKLKSPAANSLYLKTDENSEKLTL